MRRQMNELSLPHCTATLPGWSQTHCPPSRFSEVSGFKRRILFPLVFTEVEAAIEETATANPLFGQELK